MQLVRVRQQLGMARGFFQYLKEPLGREQAIRQIKERIACRERSFLDLSRRLIYQDLGSPYRRLLLWAGCDYADLENCVRNNGLEQALKMLRAEGVYLTPEEIKSQIPICRGDLTIETKEADFDNHYSHDRGIRASTSGSRSKGTRVSYSWDLFTEEAANELLLHEVHGLSEARCAFWLPAPPSISGIHNLLVHVRFRHPPEKWFSHLAASAYSRAVMAYIGWSCRRFGIPVPRPVHTKMDAAERVARWMETTQRQTGSCLVKTYSSSAVRIVQAAQEKGIDISGSVVFVGGEPLTERRWRYLQAAGVRAFPRYVATETGFIGAGCGRGNSPDSMHLYNDRLALIASALTPRSANPAVHSFLFTSLSNHTGKILLNADLGDCGQIQERDCDCLLGQLGMSTQISAVRSVDKLTGEGMTLLGSVLDEVIGQLVEKIGGGPDDYQLWEKHDSDGLTKLVIALSPRIGDLDEPRFVEAILRRLKHRNTSANIVSHFWKQANTLQIVRAEPEITGGFKRLPIVKQP